MKYLRINTFGLTSKAKEDADEDMFSLAAMKRNVSCIKNHIYLFDEIDEETQLLVETYMQQAYTYLMTASAESLAQTGTVAEPIYLHINSPGGDAMSSFALYDFIKNFKVPVVGLVEGMAASGASIILCGCLTREMTENSVILCHELRSMSYGKYSTLKDESYNNDLLMTIIKKIYTEETKLPAQVLDQLLSHDLYWPADVALQYGIVDAVVGRALDEDDLNSIIDKRLQAREKEEIKNENERATKSKSGKASSTKKSGATKKSKAKPAKKAEPKAKSDKTLGTGPR